MMTQNPRNDYDDTKAFLNKIRKITKNTAHDIREQLENPRKILDKGADVSNFGDPLQWQKDTRQDRNIDQPNNPQSESSEKSDFNVINNVEVVINSTDQADLTINDDEKGKISQMIDDFRKEVSDLVKFGKLNVYDAGAKLDGVISDSNITFTLSAGDDEGLFLSNTSMLKVSDDITEMIDKLKRFQFKFSDVMGQIISNRQQN